MTAIDVQGVSKRFHSRAHRDGLTVLDDVSFAVEDREFVCLLGRSGSGKSTLLNLISGLDREYGGAVAFGGPARIGYVFQEPRLLPWLTVRDNLLFARAAHADEWIERVGLGGFERAYPHELSGGMQQRASIARAFAIDPDVLLMDEPFSGLDEFTGRGMRELLLELWRDTRKTVLFVTHHCFEACYLADRILVLGERPGRAIEEERVGLPRPRDYDSTELFELSVRVTRLVMNGGS
jgi:NitT/TauT family transport system ATP-binding protein